MNELRIFSNKEFGEVRTVTIDGEPWFVGKDVAAALGYEKPTDAIRKHIDEEDRGISKMETPSGKQNVTIINESGMYSLIMSSKLPSAKKFKHWVTSEVLPSLRKNGSYQMKPMSPEEMMRVQLGMIDGHEERLNRLENTMNIDYAQMKQLKNLANEVVVSALGGKKAKAYRFKDEDGAQISKQAFSRFWHDFNDFFNINAYANLPRIRFDEALEYVNQWHLPINMQLEVGRINRMTDEEHEDAKATA